MLDLYVFLKAQRKPVLQFLSRRVHQQDAEHLVVDQAAEQFGNTLKQLIHIQDGVSSRAISFSRIRVRACFVVRVCSRAFSIPIAMRDPISVSSRLCSSVKRPASWRLEIQHTDDPIFHDQRNGQLGAHVGSAEMYSGCFETSSTRMASRRCAACPVTPWPSLILIRSATSRAYPT